jgi:hypothetical protein
MQDLTPLEERFPRPSVMGVVNFPKKVRRAARDMTTFFGGVEGQPARAAPGKARRGTGQSPARHRAPRDSMVPGCSQTPAFLIS